MDDYAVNREFDGTVSFFLPEKTIELGRWPMRIAGL